MDQKKYILQLRNLTTRTSPDRKLKKMFIHHKKKSLKSLPDKGGVSQSGEGGEPPITKGPKRGNSKTWESHRTA